MRAAAILAAMLLAACDRSPAPAQASAAVVAAAIPVAPVSPWGISRSQNEVTGEKTLVASSGFGERSLIVRAIGRKFVFYITTGEFLETVENADSRLILVKYKIDDESVAQQYWKLSDDNTALFYPGNVPSFIQKLRRAKRFAIEYKPSENVPETASFDVSLFPSEMATTLGLK